MIGKRNEQTTACFAVGQDFRKQIREEIVLFTLINNVLIGE